MVKSEVFHEFYNIIKNDLNLDDIHTIIVDSKTQDEKEFVCLVSNYILQCRQRDAIRENKY